MHQGRSAMRQGSLMKQKAIDFRELLERLLPLEELPPARRFEVQRALKSGVVSQLENAALLALQQLEKQGVVRRLDSPANGDRPLIRYQTRDALDVISIQLTGVREAQGVQVHPRALLPAEAEARLDRVRTLLRLEDALLHTTPGLPQPGLIDQLDLAGREFLGASAVRFVPSEAGEDAAARPLDARLAETVRRHPEAVFYCPDTLRAPRLSAAALQHQVQAVALVAVRGGDGEVRGHLEAWSHTRAPFTLGDLALMALLADTVGGLLDRAARIEKLVFVDPLTSAYNRSYFDLQVQNELARAQRERGSVALCIVDIDDFKSFNSAFGYDAGNRVLIEVAHALRGGVRPFDTVARWGGEEFAVLLTAPVNAPDVVAVSERLRSLVERHAVSVEGLDRRMHEVGVTVSVGVAMSPEHGETSKELWRAANQALLEAKKPPKNRVVFYRPPHGLRATGA